MGRRWKKNKNKKNKNSNGDKNNNDDSNNNKKKTGDGNDDKKPYALVEEQGNFKMEAFYAYQGFHDEYLVKEEDDDGNVLSYKFVKCATAEEKEEERQRWKESLKVPLPAAFRIGNDVDSELRERLEHELDQYVGEKMEIELEPRGGKQKIDALGLKPEVKFVAPVKKIPFVPHGYQLSVDRFTIRRTAKLQPFHDWLKVQTEAGFITRQETVSMIPPVVLDAKPQHMILDMAAAPGSKTSQLLEIVNIPSHDGDLEPKGCVVANDYDDKRAYMLVHQIKRINSPAVFITATDARFFPLFKDPSNTSDGTSSEGIFDRVLCDVPCSGDGTARKNAGIWKHWNSLNGYSLHPMQLAIALRGAQSTKVGGYLCYSTCSMNPIENEAVVAELLRASDGSLELVERRSELNGLVARPGQSTWKNLVQSVTHKQVKDWKRKNSAKMQARRKEWEEKQSSTEAMESNEEPTQDGNEESTTKADIEAVATLLNHTKFEPKCMDDMDELKKMVMSAGMTEYSTVEDVPRGLKKRVRPSCFPPTKEEAEKFHLDRCMRVLPQDMNTGGFFVALLKKVAPLNARARKRFEEFQEELQNDIKEDKEAKKSRSRKDDEPKAKKPKTEEDTEENQDVEIEEGLVVDEDNPAKGGLEPDMDTGDSITKQPVHGYLKRRFLEKDGEKSKSVGKDDYIPVPSDIFQPLKEYYGLDEESFKEGQFMVRAGGDMKTLFFVTKTVKKLIDMGLQERVTVVNTGLKAFQRNSKECEVSYRVSQEAINYVAPHMSKRKISVDILDFEKCLICTYSSDPRIFGRLCIKNPRAFYRMYCRTA